MDNEWIFTFGFAHVHPDTGESLAHCYVVVPGDVNESRLAVESRFGQKWSMQYPTKEEAGVEKYKLREVQI